MPSLRWLTIATLLASAARAQTWENEPPPARRLVYRDLTAIRWNPLGLSTDARIMYRLRIYRHDAPMLRDNFVGFGLAPSVSASYARLGLFAEFQPLSMLQIWAIEEVVDYF